MSGIKRYIETYISTETCNFRCHYCYITQKRLFNNKIMKLQHSAQTIRKPLSRERLGGICLINLCAGGETLISSDIIEVIKELLTEGHYVSVVTNGTMGNRFNEICKFDKEILQRLFFKFSFHYRELQRTNLLDKFFANIKNVRNVGCSFTLEITPDDEDISLINEIKKVCIEKMGALCHCTIARNDTCSPKKITHLSKYSFEEYQKIWNVFDSPLFDFKTTLFYKKRNEFCYAGDWSISLNLSNGNYSQCYNEHYLGNIYENIEKPLNFIPVGTNCSLPHCYNGHSFLSLGVIPEMQTPTYAEMRDRKVLCKDGYTHWLTDNMREFLSGKLVDENRLLSEKEKQLADKRIKYFKFCNIFKRILRKVFKGKLNI